MHIGIGVSRPMRNVLAALKRPLPPLQMGQALIDTGATGTVVDESLIKPLGISPKGAMNIITPSTGATPVQVPVYDVSVWVLGNQSPALERSVAVACVELKHQGFEVLLGRDILADCVLVYDGKARTCLLSF